MIADTFEQNKPLIPRAATGDTLDANHHRLPSLFFALTPDFSVIYSSMRGESAALSIITGKAKLLTVTMLPVSLMASGV
jgi:hypothetical protein